MKNCQGCCSNCGSNDINYGTVELVDNDLYYPFSCNKCEKDGKEWYHLEYLETN